MTKPPLGAASPPPTKPEHEACRVLIVEDRPVARKMLQDELAAHRGIQVVGVARDGEEALELVSSLHPDVVVMDVVMPRMDGIETLDAIRGFSNVPVILLTGARVAPDSLEHVARRKGADGFFIKPSGSVSIDLHSIGDALATEIERLAALGRVRSGPNT